MNETGTMMTRTTGTQDVHAECGSITMAMLAAIIAGGLMVALVATVMMGQRSTRFDRDFVEVVQGADAGIQEALFALNSGDLDASDVDPATGKTPQYTGTLDGYTYTWQAEPVDQDWKITSSADLNDVQRTAVARLKNEELFPSAAVADFAVTFNGNNSADSYDSDSGQWYTGNGTVSSNGDLLLKGTSTTVDGVVLYDWAAYPSVEPLGENGSRCEHEGNPTPDPCVLPQVELVDEPLNLLSPQRVAAANEVKNNCTVTGGTWRASDPATSPAFVAGEKYCYDHVIFDQDTVLPLATADTPVEIYVRGSFRVGGQVYVGPCAAECVVGTDTPPAASLQVYSLDDTMTAVVSQQATVVGVVYAPFAACGGDGSNAHVDFFGSMVCGEIDNVGGWAFHYDDYLGRQAISLFDVEAWSEEQ